MKITTVSVRYSELRSTGYPSFSNRTCGIDLSASLDSGDSAVSCRDRLLKAARLSVKKMFEMCEQQPTTDDSEVREMTIPF